DSANGREPARTGFEVWDKRQTFFPFPLFGPTRPSTLAGGAPIGLRRGSVPRAGGGSILGSQVRRKHRGFVPGLEGLEMRLSAANTLASLRGLAGRRGVAVQGGRPGTPGGAGTSATLPAAVAVLGGAVPSLDGLPPAGSHVVGMPAPRALT